MSLGWPERPLSPVTLRRSPGQEEGDRLVVGRDVDRLMLEKPQQIEQSQKACLAERPRERRLVEEPIAEWRGQHSRRVSWRVGVG